MVGERLIGICLDERPHCRDVVRPAIAVTGGTMEAVIALDFAR